MTRRWPTLLAFLLALTSLSAAGVNLALKVEPASHDFGRVAIGGGSNNQVFKISIVGGGGAQSISTGIMGQNPGEFILRDSNCNKPVQDFCTLTVTFKPRTLGVKKASLDVLDSKNVRVSASLQGVAVQPECTNEVVFCNYARFYSGNFDWQTATESVKVTIVKGVATCNGSATFQGRPKGIVSGAGLVAVEFVQGTIEDSTGNEGPERLVYRITVACPSPAVPATADGPAIPSRPAELGDFFQQSYNQPASGVGINLVGSNTWKVEGEGIVSVTWSLKWN